VTPITTEDYASVLFHFENGVHGSCNISQVFAGRKNQMLLDIGGSKCALHWDSENSNALWVGHREKENGELVKDPSILSPGAAKVNSYPGGHVEGFPDTFKQNFKQIYDAIAIAGDATPGDKSPGNFATFDDGVKEMKALEKILQSARERRWVSL
jgi:predicted dehydrogenase